MFIKIARFAIETPFNVNRLYTFAKRNAPNARFVHSGSNPRRIRTRLLFGLTAAGVATAGAVTAFANRNPKFRTWFEDKIPNSKNMFELILDTGKDSKIVGDVHPGKLQPPPTAGITTSNFAGMIAAPPIEVFEVNKAYQQDIHPNKVNLSIGAYRTEEEKPWVLPVVRKVEKQIADDDKLNHEYFPQLGMEALSSAAAKLLLGSDNPLITNNKVIAVQSLSGTGALRIGAELLVNWCGFKTILVSNPTWDNHILLFNYAGSNDIRTYHYWDDVEKKIDMAALLDDLKNAPDRSVVVLHVCAHNPTGMDPTEDEWREIADVMEEKKHFPFFDCAYQGFASGDVDRDAFAVRYFAKRGFELVCAQSFAKNFGLYNERIGNLTVIVNDELVIPALKSQLTLIVRAMYSNPPANGARIVSTILNNPNLMEEWKLSIKMMADRIQLMRKMLYDFLLALQTPGSWEHITNQIGMFSFTGLTPIQADYLKREFHVYLLRSGRISLSGLTTANVEYVAKAIHDAVTKFPA